MMMDNDVFVNFWPQLRTTCKKNNGISNCGSHNIPDQVQFTYFVNG